MTNILLSIKPVYAERIYLQTKRYEYRKSLPKQMLFLDDTRFLLYESAPVKRVTGWFVPESMHIGRPDKVWELTKFFSGIDEDKYFAYFKGHEIAFAFQINPERLYRFKEPYAIDKFGLKKPPQNYAYISDEVLLKALEER